MTLHEAPKQKERHIVTWSPEEDDTLREQISLLGTESWTAIASQFKGKTGRQCRRRWYTYLNTECKKGSWSPEEDVLLCEAQKIFGNRWTEIAKVVSGRTDNAVKNRFTTLCKKRAKYEALPKENTCIDISPNRKRVIIPDGTYESTRQHKKIRTSIQDHTAKCSAKERYSEEYGPTTQQQRPPLALLAQNFNNVWNLQIQHHIMNSCSDYSDALKDETSPSSKVQETFLQKDDPKILALIQQAELLGSIALTANTNYSNGSLENAWKELQDFLIQTDENEMLRSKIVDLDCLVDDFRDLIEDFKSGSPGNRLSRRQSEQESQGSSEQSTICTTQSESGDQKVEQNQTDPHSINHRITYGKEKSEIVEIGTTLCDGHDACTSISEALVPSCEPRGGSGSLPALSPMEYNSPPQTIPSFQTFQEGIPSPKFSDSERQYLLRTLGMISPPAATNPSPSQPPPCRRALLHSLTTPKPL